MLTPGVFLSPPPPPLSFRVSSPTPLGSCLHPTAGVPYFPPPVPPPHQPLVLNRINTVWMSKLDTLLWRCCRSFGCSAPVGTVYSINPAMIMTLVPLVGAAATHYSHFDMIHYGSYVSALSPLWMALFTTGDVSWRIKCLPHPHPPLKPHEKHSYTL